MVPTLSIVTPSFNQAAFLPQALASVLGQNHPHLEYVVMDGGSTDGSVEIIRSHEARLAFWASAPDGGHYAAVNAGFARTSGELMAWLNADDQYLPWTFSVVTEIFAQFPEVEWLTTRWPLRWDRRGRAVRCSPRRGFSRERFFQGEYRPGEAREVIQQESTFWRRSLWERAGGKLDTSFPLGGDFELWARFFRLTELYAADTPLGGFRVHGEQRSALERSRYEADVQRAFIQHGGSAKGTLARFFRPRAAAKIVRFNKDTEAWIIETVRV
ncbi:MAG TPA: glycosyltransferase family 2 protein [Chthoniobacteraceae bacterium]|jgi:glycosyltransferase involved in cell wall biosynthesis